MDLTCSPEFPVSLQKTFSFFPSDRKQRGQYYLLQEESNFLATETVRMFVERHSITSVALDGKDATCWSPLKPVSPSGPGASGRLLCSQLESLRINYHSLTSLCPEPEMLFFSENTNGLGGCFVNRNLCASDSSVFHTSSLQIWSRHGLLRLPGVVTGSR